MITDDARPATPATPGGVTTEATIKVHVGGERVIATAEGNGPVNALDTALRTRARRPLPGARRVHLTDYKVRVLDTAEGHRRGHPGADRLAPNGDRTWTTIGVSENIIEASWQALFDSLVYGLLLSRRPASSTPAMPTDPFVSPDARRPAPPGAEPRAGRAHARRRRAGVPTGPATSAPASPPGALLGRPGPERRVRAHARRPRCATGSRSRRTSTPTTRSRWSPRWR